jgi:hypothetical protein
VSGDSWIIQALSVGASPWHCAPTADNIRPSMKIVDTAGANIGALIMATGLMGVGI